MTPHELAAALSIGYNVTTEVSPRGEIAIVGLLTSSPPSNGETFDSSEVDALRTAIEETLFDGDPE